MDRLAISDLDRVRERVFERPQQRGCAKLSCFALQILRQRQQNLGVFFARQRLKIAAQARTAVAGVDKVRAQSDTLAGIDRINDSGVRILHSARALRKVAVGK